MQDQINLFELKQSWLTKLETFKRKKEDYDSLLQLENGMLDLNIDDLINPPKEEKIEMAIDKIISECIQDEKGVWPEHLKKDYLQNTNSRMDYTNQVKENLTTIRSESLHLATLLADKEIVKADVIDKQVANLSLHSFKDIDQKAKLKPVEKNYIINPLAILKEKKIFSFSNAKKEDLIINITIYHSFTGKKSQEFVVLGSQYLTMLKDKIYCISDHLEEKSDTSSYFFINNTFYNDLRAPTSKDLSKEIIETQEKKLKRKMAEQEQPPDPNEYFKAQNMQDTKFEDLEITLGKPYLYRHQNSCDHLLIFNDIRMRDSSDFAMDQVYPINIFQNKIKRKRCDGCFLYFAKIMCFNDKMQSQDPSFFCEKCYVRLHFDKDEQVKVKNFQVYPYIHE